MRSNVFKLSAITATIAASFGAHAAVYNVYSYLPVVDSSAKTFGVAIQPSAEKCWTDDECNANHRTYQKIAFEEQFYNQGFSYRDESPFRLAFGYEYLEDDLDGFDRYCNNYLGYTDKACDNWASEQYTHGFEQESTANNNSLAYIEATAVNNNKNNVIINSFNSDQTDIVGTYYGNSLENRSVAYSTSGVTLALDSYDQSKVWAFDGNNYVGSVSKQSGNDYLSYATAWNATTGAITKVFTTTSADGRAVAQGSMRDVVTANGSNGTIDGTQYIVGYTSDSKPRPVAAVFKLGSDTPQTMAGFSDDAYLSSLFTSVNKNGIAIGEVKYRTRLDRAYPNALFYTTNLESPNSGYKTFSGSIFFSGANGKAGAINNNNEVVGQIDYGRLAEIDGTEREKKAFVTVVGDKSKSEAPFKNGAYYLDDLTMGDNTDPTINNNEFRIIDATDINDAGVISGTAKYCPGGYSSEAMNASCSQALSLVAVKLVPIQNADSSKIQPRIVESTSISRSGGSLGWLALGLLTLLGFRRKK